MSGRRAPLSRAIAPDDARGDSRVYDDLFRVVRGDTRVECLTEEKCLRQLAQIKRCAELMTWRAIDDARAARMGWEQIGQALGMTRQGAQQLYSRKLAGLTISELLGGL